MECPHCHKTGNVFQRLFTRRSKTGTRFCIYCNAEVRVNYKWMKIFLLALLLVVVLIVLNIVLQMIGWPGITGGFAGGIAGAVLAIYMRRPPFVEIELVPKQKKKSRK